MALRPYWAVQIRLSLVSLPVSLYTALNRSRQVPLHEIYHSTGQRVRHQNTVDGEPIDRKDIVKGYEVSKGEYVILEPDEIKALKIPSKETMEIVQFVPADTVDEIYYDTPYFIVPNGKAEHLYEIEVPINGRKEHYLMIRNVKGLITLSQWGVIELHP